MSKDTTNLADEIARAMEAKDDRMSELAVVRTERAHLLQQISRTLPQHVFREKNGKLKVLGAKEQAIVAELAMLNRRISALQAQKRETKDNKTTLRDEKASIAKWFMQVAYDVLDPAVFDQIANAALLRAQIPKERESQPGDGRSFANSQWTR